MKKTFDQLRPLGSLVKLGLWAIALLVISSLFFGKWFDGLGLADNFSKPPSIKGLALGTFHQDPAYNYQQDIDELKFLGVNTILVMIPWYQKDIYANSMVPHFNSKKKQQTIPDQSLIRIIDQAHQSGIQVMLMPYLRFEKRKPKEWRGVLAPKIFKRWAKQYENFILHYAQLAEKNHVAFLSIGSELGSLETKEQFWKELIIKVRKRFSKKLLYSSNWDHYTHPKFWEELDYIGITSYHQLSKKTPPNLAELRVAWQRIKVKLLDFLKTQPDKKIIFTEVGYRSVVGTSKAPWNYVEDSPISLEEQALCYRAFIETWNDTNNLAGVFWWVWFGDGGPHDKDYTPRNKPAAELIKKWYRH